MSFWVPRLLVIFIAIFGFNVAQAQTTTYAATAITSSSANLSGTTVSPAGGYFRYSTVSSTACASGTRAPTSGTIGYGTGGAFARVVTALLPNTLYYYCGWG